MLRIRTGFSFRSAAGSIESVLDRLTEIGAVAAPITDRASTFGWVRWESAARKKGLKPVFGVELAVTPSIHEKKPVADHWTFIAKDSIQPINELVELATKQFRYQPLLTYEQALAAPVFKMAGHRAQLDLIPDNSEVFVPLGPASAKGYIKRALAKGLSPAATSDNRYVRPDDQGFYEVVCGRNAESQNYPQHILSALEWSESLEHLALGPDLLEEASSNSYAILKASSATLQKAAILRPERPATLLAMCEEGAQILGCDLSRPVYRERLMYELRLIVEKSFEDYFYLVADICQFARSKMIVGPARGSSCGSLVCYLLGITTIDPIPYGLIFERFIDVNRDDLPDIDIDFSDSQRHLVFEYINDKYGSDRVARLGTVALFKARSSLQEVGAALKIPRWKCDAVAESMIERSSGDARALNTIEDTLKSTPAGQEMLVEYPEAIIVARMEGHPRHHSQHAAGIVISEEPVSKFVAVDHRTGATMCDKKDAETLNLLKIDALGLTQLSVFEDALEMASLTRDTLEKLTLDDQAAFDVLNKGQFSGIFQFNGMALQSITKQFRVSRFDDIVSVTALGRPGPLASGGANEWIRRRNEQVPITYPHPVFEPYLKDTQGVVLYQEQVMEIGRNIGDLDWAQVTALRKAMSKSLGKEYFDQFGDPWKKGAISKGVEEKDAAKVWDDLCAYGSWCLSGKTLIRNSHKNQFNDSEFFTLQELFESGGHRPGRVQKGGRREKILCWDGKGLKPKPNVDVFYSGRKKTWLVKTACGCEIRATAEHAFMVADGSFEKLKYLHVGSKVMVRGEPQVTKRKEKPGTGSGRHNWRELEKRGEAFFNGVRGTRKQVKEASPTCTECNIAPTEEIHHIDGNHKNNNIHNLQAVCRKCHKRLHKIFFGQDPKPFDKGRSIVESEIVFIGEPMVEDTYDVQMPDPHNNFLANDFVVHNSFNKSHSVAYGMISYYCCWLKAHYPFEFAAATLSHEADPARQLLLLREIVMEGYNYVPVDADVSTDKWAVGYRDGKKVLVGPLSNVKGIGPRMVQAIIGARNRGERMPERAAKLLANPVTPIDSLFPIQDAFKRLMPDPAERNIRSVPRPISQVQIEPETYETMVFCTFSKINPRDENEAVLVAKRGSVMKDKNTAYLNLFLTDDTDTIFGKIDRWKYESIGKEIVDRGRPNKALYAVKGRVRGGPNSNFRMISIQNVRYIGDIEEGR